MGKFKVNKFEADGKEYEVKDIQDVIPHTVDLSEVRGGVGNPFQFDKFRKSVLTELVESHVGKVLGEK